MTVALLKTKISIPPVQAGLISRPHLVNQLEEGHQLGHHLSLIAAPAG